MTDEPSENRKPRFVGRPSLIEGRSGDGWIVEGLRYSAPLYMTAAGLRPIVPSLSLETLDMAGLGDLSDIDLLILGTGERLRRPSDMFMAAASAKGIRIEFMDSRAAAYTFNVLAAEERAVAILIF